jgi:hypothetical protein
VCGAVNPNHSKPNILENRWNNNSVLVDSYIDIKTAIDIVLLNKIEW